MTTHKCCLEEASLSADVSRIEERDELRYEEKFAGAAR
jgi:hypothetical protein